MGGGSSTPPSNYYNGQKRDYAGGYGYVLSDYDDITKLDTKKYFDDKGLKITFGEKQITSERKLTDYKASGSEANSGNKKSKTTASGLNIDTIGR